MRECPECGARYGDEVSTCASDGVRLVAEGQDPKLGEMVGSYRITKLLGRGGMGAVYQGEHPTIGSKVAVKFLHKRYAADPAIVERFFNEAKAVNVIGHDNIVKVSDFATAADGSPYFVMEFLEGKPLSALAGAAQPLSETGPIFLQVAEGLQAAHEQGIIHRDLKPDNIFLVTQRRRTNFVKIVDFGIAKLTNANASTGRTQTGMVMGTAQYMSPEQAGGEVSKISPQSDIYALGVIMFQFATGRLPFEGENFGELLIGHLMRPPPNPRELEPGVEEDYEAVILRCLAKKPEDRFGSMGELYDALAAVLDAHGLPREGATTGPRSNPSAQAGRPTSRPPRPPTGPGTSPKRSDPAWAGGGTGTQMLGGGTGTQMLPAGNTGTVMMPSNPGEKPKNRTGALIAGAVVAVLVLAAGAFVAMRPTEVPPPAPQPVAELKPPPEPTPAPAPAQPEKVHLSLVSQPPSIKVTITQGTNAQTVSTPAVVDLQRGVTATAHLEADGFTSSDQPIDATKDAEISFVLAPLPPPTEATQPRAEAAKAEPGKSAAVKADAKPKKQKSVGDGMVDVEL